MVSLSRLKARSKSYNEKASVPETVENHRDFSSLGISDNLVASMNSMSIRRPTPVQLACIPPLLEGKPTPKYSDGVIRLTAEFKGGIA